MHQLYSLLLNNPVSALNEPPKKRSLFFDLLMMVPPDDQEEDVAVIWGSTVGILLALNHSEL